jgi:hypothetical protein
VGGVDLPQKVGLANPKLAVRQDYCFATITTYWLAERRFRALLKHDQFERVTVEIQPDKSLTNAEMPDDRTTT